MSADAYYHPIPGGTAIITRSKQHASHWALFLQFEGAPRMLIEDHFREAQEAATCANRREFRSEGAEKCWGSFYVRDSIELWSNLPPEPRELPPLQNN